MYRNKYQLKIQVPRLLEREVLRTLKSQHIFPGVILISFGMYFFFQQSNVDFPIPLYSWPTIFILIGIAFLCQSYLGKNLEMILPGIIFLGVGFHFHTIKYFTIWPDHIGPIILFISLGFFLRYFKTRNGLFYGWLFLLLAIFHLFYEKIFAQLGNFKNNLVDFSSFWPFVLIIIGGYLLFFKRK